MKQGKVKKIIWGTLLFALVFLSICLYQRKNRNLHLILIQNMLNEKVGEGLQIDFDYKKNEKIEEIKIWGDDDLYMEKDIFSKVDKAQKLIYSYIIENQEGFNFSQSSYRNDGFPEQGFLLLFLNRDEPSGKEAVFTFYYTKEWKKCMTEGFSCLELNGFVEEEEERYRYNVTDLVAFTDIVQLNCSEIVIDNVDVIDDMKEVRRINVWDAQGDIEHFKEKAEELGIECNI